MSTKLDEQPRATHYGPPAVYELRRAGVLDAIRAKGFYPNVICWRKIDGTLLAGLDHRCQADDPDRMICLPLNQLGQILYDHLKQQANVTISWDHKVTAIGQNDNSAWVDVQTPSGKETFSAPYIVGCDGANSIIRRSLFGDWEFPGKTWDQQIVATNVYYDFHKFGFEDANFIIDPQHWYMASRISKDGLWRVTYGEKVATREELQERQPAKWQEMLPGHPTPADYKIVNFSPYRVHQRLAESMRAGRFLLAADAAHLCNPFGGLGLTGGIVDVGGLFDCLTGIYHGKADDSILDIYSEVRRQKYDEVINPISSSNIRLMFDSDPETVLETNEFLQLAKRTATDLEFAKEMMDGINVIKYNFTQHYHTADPEKAKEAGTGSAMSVPAVGGASD
ncbi:FAD binding domain-containing protein [Cladophialophora immunda]|nr:FAD binding domain-containing protein [Cladophialophora immunda]